MNFLKVEIIKREGDNMNILITGARKGIGYATALELLDRGHKVYLTVYSDKDLEEVGKKEELKDKNVICLKLDITSDEDRRKVQDFEIDVLINNAAIGTGGSIIEASLDRIKKTYDVNLFGTIAMSQLYLEKMIKRDSGKIIMISSMLAEMPIEWFGIYSSTKAALTNITMALDMELKEIKSNVKVSIIEPGFYHTGFNQEMMENKYDNPESLFKNLRDEISKTEHLKVNALESHNLNSIVEKIVHAVEDEKSELIYKAPFVQKVMQKMFIVKNK
jgi:short-subunit dehydrogenase